MTCRVCGRELGPEDAFCPTCGTSQGDPARDRTAPVPVVRPPAAADPPAEPEAPPSTDRGAPRAAEPSAGPGTPPAGDRDELVDCPACGGVNSSSRVLCGRCGVELATGELPPGARPRPPAPRLSDAPRTGEPPPSPPPSDPVEPDAERGGGRRAGGFPLVAAIVLTAALLGGGVGALAAFGIGPFAAGPPVAPPVFDPEEHAADPIELQPAAVAASSSHRPLGEVRFDPPQLIDGDVATAWNSSGDGRGQTITVSFRRPVWLASLGVANGYQRDDARFLGHARLTRALVTMERPGQEPAVFSVRLLDQRGWQTVGFSDPLRTTGVTIEVLEVAAGDTYDDLAVSELRFLGWPAT